MYNQIIVLLIIKPRKPQHEMSSRIQLCDVVAVSLKADLTFFVQSFVLAISWQLDALEGHEDRRKRFRRLIKNLRGLVFIRFYFIDVYASIYSSLINIRMQVHKSS